MRAAILCAGLLLGVGGAAAQSSLDVEELAARARANAAEGDVPAAAQSHAPSLQELGQAVGQARDNADKLIGEDLYQDLPRIAEQASRDYATEIDQIRDRSLEVFEQGLELARELAGSQIQALESAGHMENPDEAAWKHPQFRLFVSQSMPDEEVRALLDLARGDPSLVLALRGLKPDQNITEVHRWIYRLLAPIEEGQQMPTITIDPEPFNELGVEHVPVLAQYDQSGELLGYALGMTSRMWMAEQIEAGRRGNLGAYGPTVQVAEVDIIEVIKARASQFDWAKASEGALDRFWTRTEAHDLPRTRRERIRTYDPTFEITQSIVAPDGTVIAQAGERINPLDAAPFISTLVFFDPADPDQARWAKAQVERLRGRPVTVMASQLRSLEGLDDLARLSDHIGAKVHSLPQAVRDTFHIQSVPTLITAVGREFQIHEQVP